MTRTGNVRRSTRSAATAGATAQTRGKRSYLDAMVNGSESESEPERNVETSGNEQTEENSNARRSRLRRDLLDKQAEVLRLEQVNKENELLIEEMRNNESNLNNLNNNFSNNSSVPAQNQTQLAPVEYWEKNNKASIQRHLTSVSQGFANDQNMDLRSLMSKQMAEMVSLTCMKLNLPHNEDMIGN